MASALAGLSVVWDVTALDTPWVLGPGLAAALAAVLLLRQRLAGKLALARRGRASAATLLFLFAVWWTLGGLGAWRAGVERVAKGTARFAEGTLSASTDGLRVGDVSLARPMDAFLPALHATRWRDVQRYNGARARLWANDADVLRLEVEAPASP